MMSIGVALFVALRSMNGYLRTAQSQYYERYQFADVFATVKRAPRTLLAGLSAIPGVAAIEGRVVADVVLDLPGSKATVTGRLVSIPDQSRPMLNGVHLVSGTYPESGTHDVIASAAFSRANRLAIGDTLGAIINGRRDRLRISGIGQSPEFVYEIRGGGVDFFPDNRRFGVIWVPQRALASAFDMVGSFNDLAIALDRGARPAAAIAAIDRTLGEYGALGAYDRTDHLSHRFVSDEIAETRVTAILIPSIFLGVTAFMLYLVTSRLVAIEREQIALLKAFGFTNGAVARHYLGFVLAPSVGGGAIGILLGIQLAHYLSGVYARFFQFPLSPYQPNFRILAAGLSISVVAAILGGLASVRAAVKLPPAEAMRPPAPARFRRGPFEWAGISRRVSPPVRIILRNIERRPGKTLLSISGLSLALAIVISGWYAFDAIDLLKITQFFEADRAAIRIAFVERLPGQVRHSLARLPGVRRVEVVRMAPVRMRVGHRTERVALQGLQLDGRLRRLIEPPNRVVPLAQGGLLVSRQLALRLAVHRGQRIGIESLEGDRRSFELPVAGVVDEVMGMSGYLDLATMHRVFGEGSVVNGALLAIDPTDRPLLERRLKALPAIGGIADREATLLAFDRTLAESFRISLVTIFGAACVIAAAVVYNSGRIALSERARELASLRVLGFSKREVTLMLLGEQALLGIAAMPVGFGLGYLLCALMTSRFAMELFRLPLVVHPRTYLLAAAVVAGSGGLTALMIRTRIRRLDLVAVLKARE
jgi:putative ABC transport system permease protein